jgi:hypothetical protein
VEIIPRYNNIRRETLKKRGKTLAIFIAITFAIFLYTHDAEAVFSIDLNFYSIDFGNMNMGDIKDDIPSIGLIITCTTDQGNPWYLKIRNDYPLKHISNPASVIPNTNFKWYGVSTSDPTNTSLVTTREDFTYEKTIYSGAAGEGASGTDITIKFELTLPPILQSGIYSTNIVFTFTE